MTAPTTQQTHTSYLTAVASALITYADAHPSFAHWLQTLVSVSIPTITADTSTHYTATLPGLLPQGDEQAVRRTYWLLQSCTERHVAGSREAIRILAAWGRVREKEAPKAFLLGLDLGVLPVGIWGKIKRKCEPMDVLVRHDLLKSTPVSLTRTVHLLTHRVVERALIMAGGSTGALEPELGDWLFGDKTLRLFGASQKTLQNIHDYVAETGAPIAYDADLHGTNALALSPALYLFDLPGGEDLVALT